ncbi:MAG TPA: cytidylate kinase-like family protein [Candidatus Limnocylindrales bacterium]
MPIVTISREFGAGGSSVAGIVAAELKAEVVDKKLIDDVAKRLSMRPSDVEAEVERPRSILERLVRSFASLEPAMGAAWAPPYPDPFFDPRKEMIHLTEEIIREVAGSGNVVIVGRGAGFVLADNPNVFRVFLRAPKPVRIRTLMARFDMTEPEARRKMHETDSNRAAYIKQLYGQDWCDPDQYDLVVSTNRVSYETAAQMTLTGARARAMVPARG